MMRRKLTIALLGAFVLGALGSLGAASTAQAARTPPTVAETAKPAPPLDTKTAQYDRRKRRFFPRRAAPRRMRPSYGAGAGMMSMGQAVRMVRARVPGRIVNASLRGRFALFRVVSHGRLFRVVVDRLRRTISVRRGLG